MEVTYLLDNLMRDAIPMNLQLMDYEIDEDDLLNVYIDTPYKRKQVLVQNILILFKLNFKKKLKLQKQVYDTRCFYKFYICQKENLDLNDVKSTLKSTEYSIFQNY